MCLMPVKLIAEATLHRGGKVFQDEICRTNVGRVQARASDAALVGSAIRAPRALALSTIPARPPCAPSS